jgi:DNA-directed RNA polymerase subunit H (RpoH/RPB5)
MTFVINKTNQEKNEEILGNVLKMLINRKLINQTVNFKKLLDDITKQHNAQEMYHIPIDHPIKEMVNGILQDNKKLTITVKMNMSNIPEFLKLENHKILILDKLLQSSNKIYMKNNIEFFINNALQVDYMSHIFAPIECSIISDANEINQICHDWNCNASNLPKIRKSDPMCKYFGVYVGQVIRIIRANKQTAQEIYYRICVDD